MSLESCMQFHCLVYALSQQINANVWENNDLLFAGNSFCKISSSRGGVNPNPLAYAFAPGQNLR